VVSAGASLEQAGKPEMKEAENAFVGRPVVVRSPRHPREEGTDGAAAAFRRGSKLARSPAPSSTQVGELIGDAEEVKETPKRTRDPASPANAQRTTPAKRSKASHEATCLEDLLELWKLLQEMSTKMMDKTARHITVATRETFVRMKALHTSILEANRGGGKDDSIRENGLMLISCARNALEACRAPIRNSRQRPSGGEMLQRKRSLDEG